jgi:hypothetical protein
MTAFCVSILPVFFFSFSVCVCFFKVLLVGRPVDRRWSISLVGVQTMSGSFVVLRCTIYMS